MFVLSLTFYNQRSTDPNCHAHGFESYSDVDVYLIFLWCSEFCRRRSREGNFCIMNRLDLTEAASDGSV